MISDRRVRAAAGLDADDPLRCERLVADEELRVLGGVDVVGDNGDVVLLAQCLAQREGQGGLAGADRAADADAEGLLGGHGVSLRELAKAPCRRARGSRLG